MRYDIKCKFAASNANAGPNEAATSVDMQVAVEEGRLKKHFSEDSVNSSGSLDQSLEGSSHPTINYPVGKPLEVKHLLLFLT